MKEIRTYAAIAIWSCWCVRWSHVLAQCAPGLYENLADGTCVRSEELEMLDRQCPPGQRMSVDGRSECNNVSAGFFSDGNDVLPSRCALTDVENNLYYCPEGSAAPIRVADGYYTYGGDPWTRHGQRRAEKGHFALAGVSFLCTAGSYQNESGATSCRTCPLGFYCEIGSIAPEECPPGTVGNETGLETDACSGLCPAGRYCPSQTVVPILCPAGRFGGSVEGLTSAACSTACRPGTTDCVQSSCPRGYFCESGATEATPCGSSARYCPEGSAAPTNVTEGHFSVGSDSFTTRFAEAPCRAGNMCSDGREFPCPPGTYSSEDGQTSCTPCAPGFFCDAGSDSAQQHRCGAISVYCPEGSQEPTRVSDGYYSSEGTKDTRSSQTPCPPGFYCVDGVRRKCEAGRYGQISALGDGACSGLCPMGHYCPEATVNPIPCPAGSFGASEGLSLSTCSGQCSPGYWCSEGSTVPNQNPCREEGTYCPRGSAVPIEVSAGFYGRMDRSGQSECEPSNSHAGDCARSTVGRGAATPIRPLAEETTDGSDILRWVFGES